MERTPTGTPVGVDDPYDHADRCDHLTGDGRCRFALEHAGDNGGRCPPSSRPSAGDDPAFAAARRADDYDCVVAGDADWSDCPHYRSTTDGRECRRCGLEEVRMAHEESRPLLEEHHLSYGGGGERDGDDPAHEITVTLCRWCHAKVHAGWARVDDDVNPDSEAIAAREERRSKEQAEFGFRTAAERDGRDGHDGR
jgi:ribosomal protein L40E